MRDEQELAERITESRLLVTPFIEARRRREAEYMEFLARTFSALRRRNKSKKAAGAEGWVND